MAAKIITFTADRLKHLGGSQSDDWNVRLANDTAQALWLTNSDDKACDQQVSAALAGLSGIAPEDARRVVGPHDAAELGAHRPVGGLPVGSSRGNGREEATAQFRPSQDRRVIPPRSFPFQATA